MHTFCQDGVANAGIGLLLGSLANLCPAITNEMVRTFVAGCVLPLEHGKVQDEWLEKKRIKKRSLHAFASIVLHLVPCLSLFLQIYDVGSKLPEEVECFLMLDQIFGILCLGPSRSLQYIDRLQALFIGHHRLFSKLYPNDVKPKLHHMHHIVDSMKQVGRLLACFVTERKHRILKKFALTTWRNFEHTTLTDCLSQQCEYLSTGHDLFEAEFLVHPRDVAGHPGLRTSSEAVCIVGKLHALDVLCTCGGQIGKAESFWRQEDQQVMVKLRVYECYQDECSVRDIRSTNLVFVPLREVLGACVWCVYKEHIIKVRLPPIVLL